MTRHFGVLIPATNTTAEFEYTRLLPEDWQAHYARVATSSVNRTPFSPPRDDGAAKEWTIRMFTSSSRLVVVVTK